MEGRGWKIQKEKEKSWKDYESEGRTTTKNSKDKRYFKF